MKSPIEVIEELYIPFKGALNRMDQDRFQAALNALKGKRDADLERKKAYRQSLKKK